MLPLKNQFSQGESRIPQMFVIKLIINETDTRKILQRIAIMKQDVPTYLASEEV